MSDEVPEPQDIHKQRTHSSQHPFRTTTISSAFIPPPPSPQLTSKKHSVVYDVAASAYAHAAHNINTNGARSPSPFDMETNTDARHSSHNTLDTRHTVRTGYTSVTRTFDNGRVVRAGSRDDESSADSALVQQMADSESESTLSQDTAHSQTRSNRADSQTRLTALATMSQSQKKLMFAAKERKHALLRVQGYGVVKKGKGMMEIVASPADTEKTVTFKEYKNKYKMGSPDTVHTEATEEPPPFVMGSGHQQTVNTPISRMSRSSDVEDEETARISVLNADMGGGRGQVRPVEEREPYGSSESTYDDESSGTREKEESDDDVHLFENGVDVDGGSGKKRRGKNGYFKGVKKKKGRVGRIGRFGKETRMLKAVPDASSVSTLSADWRERVERVVDRGAGGGVGSGLYGKVEEGDYEDEEKAVVPAVYGVYSGGGGVKVQEFKGRDESNSTLPPSFHLGAGPSQEAALSESTAPPSFHGVGIAAVVGGYAGDGGVGRVRVGFGQQEYFAQQLTETIQTLTASQSGDGSRSGEEYMDEVEFVGAVEDSQVWKHHGRGGGHPDYVE